MKTTSYAMRGELDKIVLTNDTMHLAHTFNEYQSQELERARALCTPLGYTLDLEQIHASGERFVMSGKKLVLTGKRTVDNQPVIVKYSSDQIGRKEIAHEHTLCKQLNELDFAAYSFAAPTEHHYSDDLASTCRILEYLPEETPLLKLDTPQQCQLILDALKIQAGLHATTSGHIRDIKDVFGLVGAAEYQTASNRYAASIDAVAPADFDHSPIIAALQEIATSTETIERYCGFLTHTDFAPHNVRMKDGQLYLLDQTSLHFGNKHESWARVINYMTLYNPELAAQLLQYVQTNRAPEEYTSLRLMRLYKLIYLLAFYGSSYQKTTENHKELSLERLLFWQQVLSDTLDNKLPTTATIAAYQTRRDLLRGEAEKKRQHALGQL